MLLDRTDEGETSVNMTVKSPFQDYCHPHDKTERSMASLKPLRCKSEAFRNSLFVICKAFRHKNKGVTGVKTQSLGKKLFTFCGCSLNDTSN